MRTTRQIFIIIAVLCCWGSFAAEQNIYARFLTAARADAEQPIRDPSLTDTNNLASKVANAGMSLQELKTNGEIGTIRVGMTMEEIVACWGKPKCIWTNCYGGPRFVYTDSDVIFATSSNCVNAIFIRRLPIFENGVTAPTISELIGLLGEPESRDHYYDGTVSELIYGTPGANLVLELSEGRLNFIRLERPERLALERAEFQRLINRHARTNQPLHSTPR
jgi:hypothetical protein